VRRSDPEADKGIRLSHRLVALHIGGIVVLFFVVVSSVLWVSREHNHLAAESSENLVRGGISAFRLRSQTMVRDYSIWDEAYRAVEMDDRPWIYSNIGNAAAEIGTLDLIEFVEPTKGKTFGWRLGSPPEGESSVLPPELLEEILGLLDSEPREERIGQTVLALFEGDLWTFAVARVTPITGPPPGVALGDLPFQIHGLRLSDGRLLRQIGGPLMLDGLHLTEAPVPGMATVPLLGKDDQVLRYVVWTPPKPGARILRQVTVPLLIALLAVATISGISACHASRSARRLEGALRDAKAADQSKTEFLSNVSHELRTPMNGILGVAQLLETTPLDSEQQELLSMLFISANAQMALISDLLDFSRIESGNLQLDVAPFEPATVIRDVTDMIRVAADAKGIRFVCNWADIEGIALLGDGKAFRQIATNLVSNAVKFTDMGSVEVSAGLLPEPDRTVVFIRVADTGRGIPEAALPRIFERFYQVDGSSTRSADGTGLGLAISQGLAEMMGGTIGVESAPGIGSTFVFSAPFEEIAAPGDERHAA
jgi:signal transduction histidine kinase